MGVWSSTGLGVVKSAATVKFTESSLPKRISSIPRTQHSHPKWPNPILNPIPQVPTVLSVRVVHALMAHHIIAAAPFVCMFSALQRAITACSTWFVCCDMTADSMSTCSLD